MLDGSVIEVDDMGDQTIYTAGTNGKLLVTVSVEADTTKWRVGQDIYTRHYLTLSDAYFKSNLAVQTLSGARDIALRPDTSQYTLLGHGATDQSRTGDHVVCVDIRIPKLCSKGQSLIAGLKETPLS